MGGTVRGLIAELILPTTIIFSDLDALTDTYRPFRLHCDDSTAGFEATLDQ